MHLLLVVELVQQSKKERTIKNIKKPNIKN